MTRLAKRLWGAAVSLRTTAVLLALLSAFLFLNVALPQRPHDPETYAVAVRSGAFARVLLVTLGLGELPTSGPFAALVAALFVNLAAVLVDRVGTTIRRIRFAAPSAAQVAAIAGARDAIEVDGAGLPAATVADTLGAIGYRTRALPDGALWGIKHRFAPLGFPAFHMSFFLIGAGALQLYLTRDVTSVVASEGQVVSTAEGAVVRRAPAGGPASVALAVERVDVRLVDGKPVDVSARVAVAGQGGPRVVRVNHPGTWGDVSVIVERAGIAPVLWLVDDRGYTVDRVVVATAAAGALPTRVPLGDGTLVAVVEPIPVGTGFPERSVLATVPVALRVESRDGKLFDGHLAAGQALRAGVRELRLQEVRYWVGLRVVRERGGLLLVAGFVLAVAGIIWRMVWIRRELAIVRHGERLRIGVRAEFFASRGREEAEAVAGLLEARRDRRAT